VRATEEVRASDAQPLEQATPAPGGFLKTSAGAVALATFFFLVSTLFGDSAGWHSLGALVVGPALFLFTLPILARQAQREGDRTLYHLLIFALVLKLLGALVRYFLGTNVYGGGVDATAYDRVGAELAVSFRAGDFSGIEELTGTSFIEVATGILYTIIGRTMIGGFVFYSWLAFIGLFFFYRAFTIAVPEGRKRTYARFVFFLPSLLVWPSSIGKEAWMVFCLGIAAYGAAKMLSGKTFQGIGIAAIGLGGAALPRAHIAALAGVAIGFGMVVRRPRAELRQLGPLIKLVSLGLIVVAGVFFVGQASDFVQSAGVDTEGGFTGALEEVADRTSGGKSNFEAPVLTSPGRAPLAIFTVLFRPTIADARSPTALLAAGEGTFLVLLTLVRFRWMFASFRLIRRRPYVTFAIAMVGALILAFSAVSNLGVLARERVQLLPFFFVLLSIPSKKWLEAREARDGRLHGGDVIVRPVPN
jgi:hypothetical protein